MRAIMTQLILKDGKERSLFRRHPWIFEGSVARLDGRARTGDTVEVVDAGGRRLAKAAFSPSSQIRARVWSFDPDEIIDDAFFKRRVAAAVARRGNGACFTRVNSSMRPCQQSADRRSGAARAG